MANEFASSTLSKISAIVTIRKEGGEMDPEKERSGGKKDNMDRGLSYESSIGESDIGQEARRGGGKRKALAALFVIPILLFFLIVFKMLDILDQSPQKPIVVDSEIRLERKHLEGLEIAYPASVVASEETSLSISLRNNLDRSLKNIRICVRPLLYGAGFWGEQCENIQSVEPKQALQRKISVPFGFTYPEIIKSVEIESNIPFYEPGKESLKSRCEIGVKYPNPKVVPISFPGEFIGHSELVERVERIERSEDVDVNDLRGILFVKYEDSPDVTCKKFVKELVKKFYKSDPINGGKTLLMLWKQYNYGYTSEARSMEFNGDLVDAGYLLFPTYYDLGYRVSVPLEIEGVSGTYTAETVNLEKGSTLVESVMVLYEERNESNVPVKRIFRKRRILEATDLNPKDGIQSLIVVDIDRGKTESGIIKAIKDSNDETVGWVVIIEPGKTARVWLKAQCALRGYKPPDTLKNQKKQKYSLTPFVKSKKKNIIVHSIIPENWTKPDLAKAMYDELLEGIVSSGKFNVISQEHKNKIMELFEKGLDDKSLAAVRRDWKPLKAAELILFPKVSRKAGDSGENLSISMSIETIFDGIIVHKKNFRDAGEYNDVLMKIRTLAERFVAGFKDT